MATYTTSDFKPGLKFMQDGEPCVIVENEFVKPGKGQAFTRTRIRKLISGKVLDVNFKSGTSVEAADVMDLNLTYSYKDDAFWYFMHPETFEQYSADAKAVGDAEKWLLDQADCIVTLWNGAPITVTPPNFVELEIIGKFSKLSDSPVLVVSGVFTANNTVGLPCVTIVPPTASTC